MTSQLWIFRRKYIQGANKITVRYFVMSTPNRGLCTSRVFFILPIHSNQITEKGSYRHIEIDEEKSRVETVFGYTSLNAVGWHLRGKQCGLATTVIRRGCSTTDDWGRRALLRCFRPSSIRSKTGNLEEPSINGCSRSISESIISFCTSKFQCLLEITSFRPWSWTYCKRWQKGIFWNRSTLDCILCISSWSYTVEKIV